MKRFLVLTLATATVGVIAASAAYAADDSYALNPGTWTPTEVGMNVGVINRFDDVSAYAVGDAANGISSSRHNIGNLGIHIIVQPGERQVNTNNAINGGDAWKGGGGSEVCVFCHTPHHSVKTDTNGSSFGQAPLWNRRAKAGNTYVAYGTTLGGTNVGAPGGVTLACLSCHDGVTALDNLVNGPGNYALAAGYAGTRQNFNLQEDGTVKDILGGSRRTNLGYGPANPVTATGNFTAGVAAGYEVDLSNDHPVSVPYSDGVIANGAPDAIKRASLRDRTTRIASIDLASGLQLTNTGNAYENEMFANLSQNLWADKGFISSTATIGDMLRGGNVECSSCHDPHFKNLSNIDLNANDTIEQDGLFLRRVGGNAGSGVCRTCHMK